MADFYVNLNASGTPGNNGSASSPFTVNEWQNHILTLVSNTVYALKGSYTTLDPIIVFNDTVRVSYVGWNLPTNGPWRISAPLTTSWTTEVYFSDGILNDTNPNPVGHYYNCYLYFSHVTSYIPQFIDMYGCILYLPQGLFRPEDGIAQDCLINVNSFGESRNGVDLINCATNGIGTNFNIINCQTDWVPPTTMPKWDSVRADFNISEFNTNVDTPPNPGAGFPSYTNYPVFLWGETRTGIGTGSLYVPVAPQWANNYPKFSKRTTHSISYHILLDTNSTVYYRTVGTGYNIPISSFGLKNNNDGTLSVTAHVKTEFTRHNLDSGSCFDTYMVAESALGVLQSIPEKVTSKTLTDYEVHKEKESTKNSPGTFLGMPPQTMYTIGDLYKGSE